MAKHAWLGVSYTSGIVPIVSPTPPANMYVDKLLDPQPRHRVRLPSSTGVILYDLGAALPVDVLALISTNLSQSSQVHIRASTSDPSALTGLLYDSGSTANVTHTAFNGNVICTIAAPVTARYWRITIAGPDPIDIGLVPIGLLFRPGRNYAYGAREGRVDLSTRPQNPHTGGEFPVKGPTLRTRLITIAGLAKLEVRRNPDGTYSSFDDFDRSIGAGGDVLFIDDPDDTWLNRARDSVWGGYREIGADLSARIASQNWARAFRVTERL